MAIIPETQYPGKIAPSTTEYPYGAARNITVPGDGTGTPWDAGIVNDLWGWQQAMLVEAGIVPSGTPEEATASQYTDALKAILLDKSLFAEGGVTSIESENFPTDRVVIFDSHSDGDGVGGSFVFLSGQSKDDHDGVTIVSPTVPWTNDLGGFLKGTGETDAGGSGCWVLINGPKQKSAVAVVIDDGILTPNQYTDIPPIFEGRGLRCGFAVIPQFINSGRFTGSQIADLDRRGFEIIAHSVTDLATSTSKALCDAELGTAFYQLSRFANIAGYQAANSVMSDTAVESARRYYGFAFSQAPAESLAAIDGALVSDVSGYTLGRVNIDGANSALGIPAAQKAAINWKSVVLYEHYYTTTAALISILDEVEQYKAVRIVTPSEIFADSNPQRGTPDTKSERVRISDFSSGDGSVNHQLDSFFFSPTTTGANKVVTLERNVEAEEVYTVSLSAIASSGVYNVSFGVHYLDDVDAIIANGSVETDAAPLDSNGNRRYHVTAVAPDDAVKLRFFMRVEVISNGTITASAPRLSKSGSILKNGASQPYYAKTNLPTQSLDVSGTGGSLSNAPIALPTVDEAEYGVSGDTVTWRKGGAYAIRIYSVSRPAPAGTNGAVLLSMPSQNGSGSPMATIAGNATLASFSGETTVSVNAGDTASFAFRAKSDDAAAGVFDIVASSLSAIEIQRIG